MGLYDDIDNKLKNLRSKRDEVEKVDDIRQQMLEINEVIREQVYLIGQHYWKKYYDGEYAPTDDIEYFEEIDRCNAELKYLSKKVDDCKVVGLVERESIDDATNFRIQARINEAEARRKQRAEEREKNRIEKEKLRAENEEKRRIEKAEQDRIAAEKAAERAAEKEQERIEKEKLRAENEERRRIEKEQERIEKEKLHAENEERRRIERAEKSRRVAEKAAERARIAVEKAEAAKAEAEDLMKKGSDGE